MKTYRQLYIRTLALLLLLLAGGVVNEAWAAKVTYHILTLPIEPSYHMVDAVTGHRLEAIKVVVDNQTIVELPAHYKSPLATGFTYYAPSEITIGSTVQLYTYNTNTKGTLYDVNATPTATAEGTMIPGTTAEYYVVYTYNKSNTIAQLDGSVDYNIGIKGKGFLSLNRGRNNRPAVVPSAKVDPEMLASPDFMKVENPGGGITTYWQSNDNKNAKDEVESQFHFIFRFEGLDPYNIIIRTAYNRDFTYIEKNDDNKIFVYKWYKEGQLFSAGTANSYIASDVHRRYTTEWSSSDTENPTDPDYEEREGEFHGQSSAIWSSYAILNNVGNTGYVFMGTRTVDGKGDVPTPGTDNKYYYLKFDNNNLTVNKLTAADATKSYSTEGIYPIEKVTFKIPTPFYKVTASEDHIISVPDWVSKYTVDNDPIDTKYLPASLRRKYCTYTGKFYSDAACTNEITKFSQATKHATEGYQVYIGYTVSASIPFKAITPAATYDASTWAGATWYELTDEGSTQEYGKKLKCDGTNFKNNGAAEEYLKTSEYAFIGDPYELRVVYRNSTSGATAYYVGATGDTPATGTSLTASTTATAGYKWQMPYDATAGSFLLQLYKGTGNLYWDAGHPSPVDIAYGTKAHTYNVATANAQTVTFNISGLTFASGYYITVTAGGTNSSQVTVPSGKIEILSGGTASFTAAIKSRGDGDKTFTLSVQQYNASNVTVGEASVITVNQNVPTYTSNTVQYSTASSTRVKVMELPELTYIYNIVDTHGNIAIQGTASKTIYSPLTRGSIPATIFSPFLADETVTFWSTFSAGTCTNEITETPATNNANIYVKYTTSNLSGKSINLTSGQRFKVQLNGEYIYYDINDLKVLSSEEVGNGEYYSWQLEGQDPYAMKIKNVGLNQYVNVASWANELALGFDENIGKASRFIAMLSNYGGIYEVLAATGTLDSNSDMLHIGRPSESNAEVKIYNEATYAHGADELRFVLSGEQAIHYHLIDKAGAELLEVSSYNARLTLPAEYVSPLVGTYYYYPTSTLAAADISSGTHSGFIAEIENDTKEDGTQTDGKGDYHVYVTYTVNDLIGFNNSGRVNDHPYLLKFLDPYEYYLEDGNDALTSEKLEAIYPYCNGDGNLNIYGETMRNEQMNGGSSTRPRWVWFFESANNDPYHVRIHSRSTISYNGTNYPTYLETKAVHFNQSAENVQTVITGGSLPGIAATAPTEYMVLGLPGAYKLVTTNPIDDGFTNERRTVDSFEQYWKTYNMVKLHVLGVSESTDAFSNDESTWVVPTDKRAELNTKLEDKGIGSGNWHSYDVYANATRWNGYNDKEDGHTKKVVEKQEHWFQTFNMGNGTFNIEDADIPPVLVLLDRHGWEIMRKPLPEAHYPEGEDELEALRVYDSPMVDKYYFYSNATKASGCHKYSLRLNDKGQESDQIKVNGVHYSSASLADLPPASASGVKSSGVLNDQFVTYTVKEEYEKSYTYNFTDNGDGTYTESGTPSKFLMLQNARFARDNGSGDRPNYLSKPIHEASNPVGGNVYDMIVSPQTVTASDVSTNVDENKDGKIHDKNLWYIQPNLNIDKEMGIKWAELAGGSGEPLTEYETKKAYKDKTGFDPYNIQLQNVDNSKYLTTHMTFTKLENGIMVGDYSGEGDSENVTLADWVNVKGADTSTPKKIGDVVVNEGYDHTNLQVTNQTFMAVSDANGNMQLMPRFDHTKRIDVTTGSTSHTTLQDPVDHTVASALDNSSMGSQTTFFVRPQRFIYHIIDNQGREALRYTRGGDYYPTITEHFKSPLATDFTYYKDLTLTDGVYTEISENADISSKEITGSLASAGYTDYDCDVYVRYSYDESADHDADRILQGKWFTVKLDGKDMQSSGTIVNTAGAIQGTGVDLYAGENSRSLTATGADDVDAQAKKLTAAGNYYFKQIDAENYWFVNVTVAYDGSTDATYSKTSGSYATEWSNSKPLVIDADYKKWQWKFLTAPIEATLSNGAPNPLYEAPDPYCIKLYNRDANYSSDLEEPNPMSIPIKVPNANDGANRFALLSHPSGGYALAVAKTYSTSDYSFLNGENMTTPDNAEPTAATTVTEGSFTYKSGDISNHAQLLVSDDVTYHFTYNVITNEKIESEVNVGNKLAVTATQTNEEAAGHEYIPYLPESAQTPLLNMEDYKYYGSATISGSTYTVAEPTKLLTLYGLYDDVVYVRYDAYSMDKTNFKVPNERNATDAGDVARGDGSHDVALNINGGLPYNIIWEGDKMMSTSTEESATITGAPDKPLSGEKIYVWYFEGNDPYALKIRHKESSNYVDGTATLQADAASAKQFMLLRKTGYDYGILQETNGTQKLTGYGESLTSGDPTKFIIFGLSVHDLIYRLIINTTNQHTEIPYRSRDENYTSSSVIAATDTLMIKGTTQRNLTAGDPAGSTYQLGTTLNWGGSSHIYSYDAGTVSIGDKLWVPNIFYRPNCTFDFYIQDIYDSDKTTLNDGLNNKFKGLKVENLMSDSELIDKTVVVNIVYSFNKDLATNSGLGFVTSTSQNLWYTFETPSGDTPYLAHYTNALGLQAMEGAETRYTNDYLWTPLGDVYGFKMYNRYMNKTSGRQDNVMTMNYINEGQNLYMAVPGTSERPDGAESGTKIPVDYGIFELIAGDQDGYFRVHPVANTEETKYYVKRGGSDYAVLSTTPSDWTFGLDMTLLEPYYQRAGYVGGLTPDGKTKYETALNKDPFHIVDLQAVVYNDSNIVHYAPGYYRLHNQPGSEGISTPRYASGYLHDIEKTAVSGGIPMHFYSRTGTNTTFADDGGLGSGFTETTATRGEIPIPATEYDPSTIFYFSGSSGSINISTQGLNVLGEKMTTSTGTSFTITDIGGGIIALSNGANYLSYKQSSNRYDLKYGDYADESARWCMEPANNQGLLIETHSGGDGYYYTTFYAPFDVLLPADADGKTYNAYICKKWYNEGINPSPVPANGYYTEGKFVPAGTPVIIRVKDESGSVTLTLPSTSPSSALASNIFSGEYLEQLLALDNENKWTNDVYTLGLSFTSPVSKDGDYDTTGDISAPLPEQANSGVGFYINATRNKEIGALEAAWARNNRYVLHNKIYYRSSESASARSRIPAPQFVPVIFDDIEEVEKDEQEELQFAVEDDRVFDVHGRCIVSGERARDGLWKKYVPSGVYLQGGKKYLIK